METNTLTHNEVPHHEMPHSDWTANGASQASRHPAPTNCDNVREGREVVWTIAGSDSGGGAGIQADLLTIYDLGGHGCSVITTLTAQSSVTVNGIEKVSDQMLLAQLSTLLADLPPKAIKIGLLADQAQLEMVASWLRSTLALHPQLFVILDPVMVATCGADLVVGSKANISVEDRLDFSPFNGLLSLITPNFSELSLINRKSITTEQEFVAAARCLGRALNCSVLAKGGDVPSNANWAATTASDLLVCRNVTGCSAYFEHGHFWLSSPRLHTINNHGSGCTLSSAIATFCAKGYVMHDAVVLAKAYINRGLEYSYAVGQGAGPLARTGIPSQLAAFPQVSVLSLSGHVDCDSRTSTDCKSTTDCKDRADNEQVSVFADSMLSFKKLNHDIGVYPVVNCLATLESLLQSGAKTVQLRIKTVLNASDSVGDLSIEARVQTAIALGRHYQAQVFINDHWQLALKHGAFGIHLGQEDLFSADLAAIADAGIALGLSSHGFFEMLLAHQWQPSYLALGHIFPTPTKKMPSKPQGIVKLGHYVKVFGNHYPLVAIGGIAESNLESVKSTLVANIAVVRAIAAADVPSHAFLALSAKWGANVG